MTGENSHKLEEYYSSNAGASTDDEPKTGVMGENSANVELVEENNNAVNKTNGKGKGVGKKSKGKENVSGSFKRDREDCVSESVSKRIKVDEQC